MMNATSRPMVRHRPVSFGNPALGTYHGFVYTLEGDGVSGSTTSSISGTTTNRDGTKRRHSHSRPVVEEATEVRCLVAVVDVPPEQIPEGILNLSLPHRSFINHVRIVIAEHNEDNKANDHGSTTTTFVGSRKATEDDDTNTKNTHNEKNSTTAATATVADSLEQVVAFTVPPSPNASAMESAASILAEEQQRAAAVAAVAQESQQQQQQLQRSTPKGVVDHATKVVAQQQQRKERTYLVLIELCHEEAADELVRDLHQQPYTSLDETVTCSVYHVVALQGVAGVSLMSPFFAPTSRIVMTTTSATSAATTASATTSTVTDNATTAASIATSTSQNQLVSSNSTSSDSTGATGTGTGTAFPSPSIKTASEDYNCAVCLEHMDLGGTTSHETASVAILTTVCNHSFHLDCLLQWQDSPCPVCRYDHSGLNEALSQCHVCGTTEHNYVCLICGVVSCGDAGGSSSVNPNSTASLGSGGRAGILPSSATGMAAPSYSQSAPCSVSECRSEDNVDTSSSSPLPPHHTHSTTTSHYQYQNQRRIQSSSHARQHYDETLHAYALNTETQHVWDFAGQGYVHRLLQNKEDGKLVEVNDPTNTTSQERSLSPGLTEAQEGEVVHRKLEGFASQYYTLLKSQLEQQRIFYEGRLEEIRHEYSASSSSTSTSSSRSSAHTSNNKHRVSTTTDLIAALKQERHQLSQRLLSLQTKGRKVQGNVAFIKSLNESLEENRGPLRRQVEQAQRDRMDARKMFDECLPPLQEKVTRLMLQLENNSNNNSVVLHDGDDNDSKLPAAAR